jgi:hypothetical protein
LGGVDGASAYTAVPPLTGALDDALLPLPLLVLLQAPATRASAAAPSATASILPRRLNPDLPCRCVDEPIAASP